MEREEEFEPALGAMPPRLYLPAMEAYRISHNAEPQSGATAVARATGVGAVEALEDAPQLLLRYPSPGVVVGEVDVLVVPVVAGEACLLYTSPSPRDKRQSRMPSSA